MDYRLSELSMLELDFCRLSPGFGSMACTFDETPEKETRRAKEKLSEGDWVSVRFVLSLSPSFSNNLISFAFALAPARSFMYCGVRTNGIFFGTIPSFHTSSAMMIYDDVVWCTDAYCVGKICVYDMQLYVEQSILCVQNRGTKRKTARLSTMQLWLTTIYENGNMSTRRVRLK